jgi:phosphatidylserine synthase
MILSGIIGAVLFSLPNLLAKIAGATFIHLWFILDCSDGEVARYTKKYSKYGKEFDFMAHLINHPLFGIALFFSLFQLGRYDFYILLYIIVASNFLDYLNRNLNTLQLVIDTKSEIENKGYMPTPQNWTFKKIVMFFANIFTIYPNLILFGVIVYFIDYSFSTDFLYYYLILNVILTFLYSIWGLFKFTRKFYNS